MRLTVIVHPNSKKPRVEKDLFGNLQVYVSQPPLEGKANGAAIKALAEHFQADKGKVRLINGAKSKNKVFLIED